MKDLRKIAQQQTLLSKIMEGREKITMKIHYEGKALVGS